MFLLHKLNSCCWNYWKVETIQARKLFEEIRYVLKFTPPCPGFPKLMRLVNFWHLESNKQNFLCATYTGCPLLSLLGMRYSAKYLCTMGVGSNWIPRISPFIAFVTKVVYLCSSLLQLSPGSRNLSQAEKRITDNYFHSNENFVPPG